MKNFSTYIVSAFLHDFLENLSHRIDDAELVRSKLDKYCSNRVILLTNELNDQVVLFNKISHVFQEDNEPDRICVDNLTAVEKVQEKQESERNETTQNVAKVAPIRKKTTGQIPSSRGETKRQKRKIPDNSQLKKLQIYEEEDDEIKEARKQLQQRLKQQQRIRKELGSQKSAKLYNEYEINFDYDGQLIKTNLDQRKNNLVSKPLKAGVEETNQNYKSVPSKEKTLEIKEKVVVLTDQQKKQLKQQKARKKRQNKKTEVQVETIEFSNFNPAQNFDCNMGVRFIHDKAVVQKKEKQLSAKQLRKTITTRKLSRNEYRKIQNNPKPRQGSILTSTEMHREKRVQSQNKARVKRPITQEKTGRQKIQINDEELKKMMLKKISGQPLINVHHQAQQKNLSQKEQLNHIDRYNLDYINNRLEVQTSAGPRLPKLTQQAVKPIIYHKYRQRGVNNNALRQIRRKFEENLRT